MTARLYHITSEPEAEVAKEFGQYRPEGFAREGFVHCSYAHQVEATANRLFRGRRDLVLLEIDPTRVGCRVVDENLEGGTELFPHVYGPIPMSAIVRVHPFVSGVDGTFDWEPSRAS